MNRQDGELMCLDPYACLSAIVPSFIAATLHFTRSITLIVKDVETQFDIMSLATSSNKTGVEAALRDFHVRSCIVFVVSVVAFVVLAFFSGSFPPRYLSACYDIQQAGQNLGITI